MRTVLVLGPEDSLSAAQKLFLQKCADMGLIFNTPRQKLRIMGVRSLISGLMSTKTCYPEKHTLFAAMLLRTNLTAQQSNAKVRRSVGSKEIQMAAIEKICEFSGEYPGYLMWKYKRNHIQILPKYRYWFRNANATLVVKAIEPVVVFKGGGKASYDPDADWLQSCGHYRVLPEYYFEFRVLDEDLQGEVSGCYANWTTDFKDTKKRLKRMLRCRNIRVKFELDKA
jgi:hypothetical protein